MIRIVGPRVLVALAPNVERTTDSGIILARDPELRAHTQGIVMQLGEKSGTVDIDEVLAIVLERSDDYYGDIKRLAPAPFDVAVGDMVLFPPSVGELFEQDGIRYLILAEQDIIGVVEQKEAA